MYFGDNVGFMHVLDASGDGIFLVPASPEEAVDQEASHVLMLRASAVIPEAQEAKKGGG